MVAVLSAIASGRFRIDLVALSGLIILGLSGFATPQVIFSGFGHPALATIIAVFFISQGLVNSGLLRGLGQALAGRVRGVRGQVIGLSVLSALLSSIMNNVGAVGLLLPTAVRMSGRAGQSPGLFGLPLAVFSILGGTITLIGSAPNIIIASYMFSVTGQSFKMFDFTPHGLAMLTAALGIWLFCKTCGLTPGAEDGDGSYSPAKNNCKSDNNDLKTAAPGEPAGPTPAKTPGPKQAETAGPKQAETAGPAPGEPDLAEMISFAPFSTRKKKLTMLIIIAAIAAVSSGLLHPAYGFGGAALLMIPAGVLKFPEAYLAVDFKIVFFLGAMLGIGQVLEHTGSLELLSSTMAGFVEGLEPFFLIVLIILVASALSNAINNAASAVFMAPLAAGLAAGSNLEMAAALMAAAAGSNLTLLLPTHQAALMVLSKAPFPFSSFLRFGLVLTIACSLAAAAVIALIWQ